MPPRLEPMLATPLAEPPTGDGWAYEIKWDGIRALSYVAGDSLKLSARRGADHTPRYPELAGVPRGAGRPRRDPRRRDRRLRRRGPAALSAAAAADGPLHRGDDPPPRGRDASHLRRLRRALARRRVAARAARTRSGASDSTRSSSTAPNWRAPRNHVGDGAALWDLVQERDLEGIVAKRLGSPYRPGKRSREWAKVRNRRGQELVIGGWMPGEGSRGGRVGSLLVGHYVDEQARLRGRRRHRLHPGHARRADQAAEAARAPRLAVRARRGPEGQVRAARPRPRRRAGLGRARSWSPRSSSPSGRTRAPCASRRSRACAKTRTRARWSGDVTQQVSFCATD